MRAVQTIGVTSLFLRQAVAYYASLGVRIERVMTDNGTGYKNQFRAACEELGIRHIRTRPYTPKTNGKVERFVQTSLREWAYVRPYESSAQRQAALQPFIDGYNWLRPHSALNHQSPVSRSPAMYNLLKLDSEAELLEQSGTTVLDSSRWLSEQLLAAGTIDRAMRSVRHQIDAARFPAHRDLAGSDFGTSPVDRKLAVSLADISFT